MAATVRRALEPAAIVVAFALATSWVLWPLPRHASTGLLDANAFYGRGGWLFAPDAWLVQWILGWDTHALTTAPWRLFDANIFYPAPHTLALSEHLLGYWPLFAPVYLATANPTLAYNATLLASFALSGAAMCVLVRHWTGSIAAGAVAGTVYAFAPWRIAQLGHPQLLGLYAAPLVLLGWDRSLARGRRGDLLLLGGAFLVQCLCSYYLAYCTLVLTAAYALATLPGARPGRVAAAAAALAVAAGLFALVSLPYLWVRASGVLPDAALGAEAGIGVPSWRHYVWPLAGGSAMRPYQGRVALALAALALLPVGAAWGRAARPQLAVVIGLVVTAVLGYLLALGRDGGAFPTLLREWVPGFAATRVPARFTVLVSFATAALAGIGWATIAGRLGPAAAPVTAALLAAIAADAGLFALRVPVAPAPDADGPVARWLAAHGDGRPVLELPVRRFPGDPAGARTEQLYALRSLVHLQPQLTGRSGYVPPSYELLMAFARRLPDGRALDGLVSLSGVGWVVTHGAPADAWATARLELAATLDEARVYRVEGGDGPRWEDELVARLRGAPETATFAGTPLAPLTPHALDNEVAAFGAPSRLKVGGTGMVTVVTRNAGPRTWPGVALDASRIVVLRLVWRDEHGRRVPPAVPPVRGLSDTPPGAVASFQATIPAPLTAGPHRLAARLAQGTLERRIGGQTRARVMVEP
jgi:hypothetical protein